MKRFGLLYILCFFILLPGNLYPEELYSIGIRKDLAEKPISLQHYRDGKWEEESFPPGDQFEGNFSPALGISPSGEIWVVWAARKSGENPKIYFSRSRGTTWTESRRVTQTSNSWEMTPAISFGDDGLPLIAWSHDVEGIIEIFCARWDGIMFGPEERISTPDNSPDVSPALAVSPDGQTIVIWEGLYDNYYQIFRSIYTEKKWSREEIISPCKGVDQIRSFVFSESKGTWKCFWQEKRKLLSTIGENSTWATPSSSKSSSAVNFPDSGDLPLVGWIVKKTDTGKIRARRSYSLFDYPDKTNLTGEIIRTQREALGNNVYIGYGDSITYGTDGPPMGKCYIPLLQADLEDAHFETYTIHNHGYPGCNTYELLFGGGYPIRYCPGIEAVVDAYNASHILIMGGTNDYEGAGSSPALSKSYLGSMIDRARTSNCEPILATIIPTCATPGWQNWSEDLSRNYIVPLAQEKSCLLANPFEAFIDYGNWCDDLLVAADLVHPVWTKGSQVIANAWFAALSDPSQSLPLLDSGDYNGDGSSDIALFRPSSGLWAIRSITRVYFGSSIDSPASGDYNNDGITDIAIFRDSTGLWAVRGLTRIYFGTNGDISAPGDYNGDGYCNPGIFREEIGLWAVRDITRSYFGTDADIPIPGYYRGARKKEIAIFRPSTGLWACRGFSRLYYGSSNDQPVPADYDGDGSSDITIFRPSSGLWAIRGYSRLYYGTDSDQPVAAPYSGGMARAAIFREDSGLWALRGLSRIYYGSRNDIPLGGRIPRPITPTPTPSASPTPSPTPTQITPPTPTPSPVS